MPLDPAVVPSIPSFKERKTAQWKRVATALPGLQFIQSGEQATSFMLVCSTDGFYEGVIIGQLPHLVIETSGSPKNPVRRAAPNERNPLEKRAIDMTDDEVDAVISAWSSGKSALSLPFVRYVFRNDGKAHEV